MKQCILVLYCFCCLNLFGQNIGIGTNSPEASAQLDVSSTSKGLLPPRMSTVQRNAIPSPAAGLMIFNTTTASLEVYNGTTWNALVDASNYPNNVVTRKLWGGSASEMLYSIDKTNDGGYFMAGNSLSNNTGTLTGITNTGGADIWVIKTDVAGNIEWQKLLGGTANDYAYCVSATSDGGCIVSGSTSNPTGGIFTGSPGFGSSDGLIIKLTSTGALEWFKLLGGSLGEELYTVRPTSDGGYIATGISYSSNTGTLLGIFNNGSGNTDGWIVKLNATGNVLWQKLAGGLTFDYLSAIQQTNDGGYIAAGYSNSNNSGTLTGITNNGGNDVWVIKMDGTGTVQWQKLLGGSLEDKIYQTANRNALQKTTDGGYIVGAYSSSSNTGTLTGYINNGPDDAWIIKLDGSGNIQWQRLLGGTSSDNCIAIIQTLDGGFVMLGESASSNTGTLVGFIGNGQNDLWVQKLTNSGTTQWQKLIGGSLAEFAGSIIQTTTGFIITGNTYSQQTGYFTGLSANGVPDACLFKLDQFGNTY